ncbi:MAG TPA: class I SAM-dependent methyltransferase [Bryobacteraceae bacterium]|jgi:SAM-dependent methyltransferase
MKLRRQAAAVVSAHPALRESAKLILNGAQRGYVAAGRAVGIVDFPVPRFSSMKKTSSTSIRHYYVSGITCSLPIVTMALNHGVRLRENINVLDFGCGVGRQLLHLTRQFPAPRYFACDVDSTLVEFIEQNYPTVRAHVTRFDPPLPFEAGSMDMIYSVSTFSHINPEHQKSWLKELRRITRPGGYCFLTTEGWTALRMMGRLLDIEAAGKQLRETGIFYKEYDFYPVETQRRNLSPTVNLLRGIDQSYGSTVITPEFVREKWPAAGFEVVNVVEGIIDARQDLIILRRSQ